MTDADLQKIADELGEPIEIVREMNDAIKCCADEGPMEARADRGQRAREAFWDYATGREISSATFDGALDEAMSAAVRVRVDAEVLAAALDAYDRDMIDSETNVYATICAAFRAAGFEVEQ